MKDLINITVRFFGEFRSFSRDFGNKDHVALQCSNPCTIADIRVAFQQTLKTHCPHYKDALLKQSVFANKDNILSDTTSIDQPTELVILPPISGG